MATNKRTVIAADEELLVQGQLTVTGNVTQVEVTQTVNRLESNVLMINADNEAENALLVLNGESDNVTLAYNNTTGNLEISKPITVASGSVITATFVGDLTGNVTGTVSSIANHDTGDLSEGSNLYFTNARADARVAAGFSSRDTDDLAEGTNNLYFTTARARNSISHSNASGDGSISYDNGTGVITYTGPSAAETRAHFSATDAGGDGSFSYSNGVFTYTGPSASEVRAHFSGGTGIDISGGTISTDDSEIVHDSLSGFVANEHIDHSSVVVTAGAGLTGGGDITTSRTVAVGQGTGISVAADSISTNDSEIVHDNLSGYVANEHIDHTGVNLTAGDGLSGGGTIAASRSFAVDSSVVRTSGTQTIAGAKTFTGTVNLTGATVTVNTEANSDSDSSVASTAYVNNRINQVVGAAPAALDTLEEIAAAMGNSDNIGGVVTGNTGNITALQNRTISAGDGLSGGGDLTSNRSFAVDGTVVRTTRDLTAGSGLTGGGDLSADRTFNVGAGSGIIVNANDIAVDMTEFDTADLAEGTNLYYTNARADARIGLQVGTNLDLSSKDTDDLSEGPNNLYYTNARVESYLSGGSGIDFASGTIDVDGTVIRTSGNQSMSGTKTFSGELVVPSSASTATGAIYYDGSEAYIYVSGSAKKITPAVDAGDVESVGAGTTDIYAGTRVSGSTTYHGIKSLDAGTYSTVAESANVITVDADISAIKSTFGASGATLSYDSSTGTFTSTADNYGSWSFETPSTGDQVMTSGSKVTFAAGSGIGIMNVGKTITITNTNSADITAVTAGSGLTGGGTAGDVTLNVVGGSGITANANDIAVDSTVVRTTGTQTISGDKTLSGTTRIDSLDINGEYSFPTADGNSSEVLTTDGSGQLSFQSVSSIGLTNVFAGDGLTRSTGIGTVTLDVVGGTGITASANEIALDFSEFNTDNISEGSSNLYYTNERVDDRVGSLLTAGVNVGLTYNDSAGTLEIRVPFENIQDIVGTQLATNGSHTGINVTYDDAGDAAIDLAISDSYVRGLLSGGTGITYNNSTGAISLTDTGLVTEISTSAGLDHTGTSGTVNIALDLSELGDMTAAVVGAEDELILLDNGSERRKAINEINLGQFNNDQNWTSNVGDITSVGTGAGLTGGGSSGDVTLAVNTGAVANGASTIPTGDHVYDFVTGLGYSTTTGTVTSVGITTGTGLNGSGTITTSGTVNISLDLTEISLGSGLDSTATGLTLDLSEFTDMTAAMAGTDEFIVLDAGSERRKAANEIGLSIFNNDAGFTTNVGDITNVSAGNGLTGGGASGSVTLNVVGGNGITASANDIDIDLTDTSVFTSANTAGKAVVRDGSGNFSAGVITATATAARYADLAEIYATDQHYQAGTVVVFGGEKEVTVTDHQNSPRVAGVISTDPAYMMNKDAEGQYVALRGRVPCKVIGPVKKGDVLITSDRPGFACVSSDPAFVGAACIVGKAIGEWDTPSEGVVEIMV